MHEAYITLETRFETIKIPLGNIYYIEKIKSTHKICVVHAGGIATITRDLRDVLNELSSGFIQCHKSFIANTERITRIEIAKSRTYATIYFVAGISCPCSMKYRKEVMALWKS